MLDGIRCKFQYKKAQKNIEEISYNKYSFRAYHNIANANNHKEKESINYG